MLNNRQYNSRYYPIVAVIILLMAILAVRLFILTVVEHKEWKTKAIDQNSKEIYTPAPRGNIYDRNGKVLATNKQVFTVVFNSSGLDRDQVNTSIMKLMDILDKNGDKHESKFPIKISKAGKFYFTYDRDKKKWLEDNDFKEGISAEDAYSVLRNRYSLEPGLNRYEALDEIYKRYGISVPISARIMRYTFDSDKESFLEKFHFTKDEIAKKPTAAQVFSKLKKQYGIDASVSDKEALEIFSVRNEMATYGFTSYIPITVAKEISTNTIALLEESNIPGVTVASETIRYYPNGKLAGNIIGYMGSISESEAPAYIKKGYSSSDMVGKSGIEGVFEDSLRGKRGVKKIRVNAKGQYISTISETPPKTGEDVYLTIDIDLQRVAEESVERTIASTRKENPNCESGASVSIEVKTGNVLAMANVPSYDPNIFAKGITPEAWESLQSKNPRDPLAPTPLYNISTMASVQPGSTFKPITAIAAMECGLNPNMIIKDRGFVKLGDRTFGCYAWNYLHSNHGLMDMSKALEVSCNYYFYCIAAGKNWETGQSFGYSTPMNIDKMLMVAKEMGLAQKTGIEIEETVSPLPSEKRHKKGIRLGLWNALYNKAHVYFPESVADDENRLRKNIETIVGYMEENPNRQTLFKLIEENTDAKKAKIEELGDLCKFSYFNQAKWGTGDLFNLSIGQGDHAYTPLQVTNYMATLANGGIRNQVSIVLGVSNKGMTKKGNPKPISLKDRNLLKPVISGMHAVVEKGIGNTFAGTDIEAFGKTGTAERSGKINPPDEVKYIKSHIGAIAPGISWEQVENEIRKLQRTEKYRYSSDGDLVDFALKRVSKYKVQQADIDRFKGTYDSFSWFMCAAPLENPRIATTTFLVQGGTSLNSAKVNRDVVVHYLKPSDDGEKESGKASTRVTVIGENRRI